MNAIDMAQCQVMVLGAGRGPLVEAALRAAERAEAPVQLYAVEKNPNAALRPAHEIRSIYYIIYIYTRHSFDKYKIEYNKI